jgi:hypothetical protein
MSALTQQEWYDKTKSWVPDWFFEKEYYQKAFFMALAKVLNSENIEMLAQVDETFISRAIGLTLDQHGYERTIIRYPGELDPIDIALVATAFLLTGIATVYENDGLFSDRECFSDRRQLWVDITYDAFSIVVPYQGAGSPGLTVLQAIATAINGSKALGTLYRIVELDT